MLKTCEKLLQTIFSNVGNESNKQSQASINQELIPSWFECSQQETLISLNIIEKSKKKE